MIRQDAQLTVSRFTELIGVRRRTYHHRLARRAGSTYGRCDLAPAANRNAGPGRLQVG